MPRDEWAIDKITEKLRRARNRKGVRRSRNISRSAKEVARQRLTSLDTVMWFGRHKGQSVRTLLVEDPSYLRWLAASPPNPEHWRMHYLCEFLRKTLAEQT